MAEISAKKIEQIERSAVKLFKQYGYDQVTVNEICRDAEISRTAFYSIYTGKKAILDRILAHPKEESEASFRFFLEAENDFERIWILCDRFLTIALDFGPELTGSLFIMQLTDSAGITEAVHSMDSWFIKLAKNCRKSGIMQGDEPPEILAPLATDLICQVTYEWCNSKGEFSLRNRARSYAEIAYRVAPEYRRTIL